jgi:hypothetical protein
MKKNEKMEWLLWILLEDKESGETAGEEKDTSKTEENRN